MRNHLAATRPLLGRCHPPPELASVQPASPDSSRYLFTESDAIPGAPRQCRVQSNALQPLPTKKQARSPQAAHGVTPTRTQNVLPDTASTCTRLSGHPRPTTNSFFHLPGARGTRPARPRQPLHSPSLAQNLPYLLSERRVPSSHSHPRPQPAESRSS